MSHSSSSYPPKPGTTGREFYGRKLPALPTKPYPSARRQYEIGTSLRLTRPTNTHPYVEIVLVNIVKVISVNKFNGSQSVVAHVQEGPQYILGRDVFVKVFDSLYLNPDDLQNPEETPPSPRPSSGSSSDFDCSTLADSVEWSRKHEPKLPPIEEGNRNLHNDYPVESRGEFSARLFRQELRAYTLLRSMQGKSIPKFLGHFVVRFEDRELEEDRSCKVLMLELLDARILERFPVSKLSALERTRIRQEVFDIVTAVYKHGVYFPNVYLSDFMILNTDRTLRLCGFSWTYDPGESSFSTERHIKAAISGLEWELNALGYG